MAKISVSPTNDYCPQTLFLYGTYKEDGAPNFGLFCWFSYCWSDDLGVMACIGGSKMTLDRIRATKVFSANLVTEELLPLADYFGTADGYNSDKMNVPFEWERGAVLDVPVLCKIRNVLQDELLADPNLSVEEKMAKIAPVSTTCTTYFGWKGNTMGAWHEPGKQYMSE